MLILRFGLAHVLFSNFAHMCLRIVPLTDNSKLIIKIPMIMKNQLLNLKMIALMCLMMVLGGANVWAQASLPVSYDDNVANLPKGKSVASITYHLRSTVSFLSMNVVFIYIFPFKSLFVY